MLIYKYNMDNKFIKKYISQLSETEKKAMEIAKVHLGTSFNIKKCNGFIKYVQDNKLK